MFSLFSVKKYDESKRNKAFSGLALRAVVSGYVFYLAYMIFTGAQDGSSTMSLPCAVTICIVFVLCALLFAAYAVRSFIRAMKQARINNEDNPDEQ